MSLINKRISMKRIDLNQNSSLNQSPFRVPEGYFEDFQSRLMAELPEPPVRKRPASIFRMRFRSRLIATLSAAAILCAVFSVYTITDRRKSGNSPEKVLSAQETGYMVNEFCDYARLQSSDIYYYVTSDSSD